MILKDRNRALYDALKLCATDVLRFVGDAVASGAKVWNYAELEWQKGQQEDSFERRQIEKTEYFMIFHENRNAIESLRAYQNAIKEIKADEFWGYQVDQLVGSLLGRIRIDSSSILSGIPIYSLMKTQSYSLSEQYFDERVEWLNESFCNANIEYVRTTPVLGITLQEKFSLSPEITIEPLTDGEVIELIEDGLITSNISFRGGDFIHAPPRTAVVSRFVLPKIVGEIAPIEAVPSEVTDLWGRLSSNETITIDLLTLTLGVAVAPLGTVTRSYGVTNGSRQIQKNAIPNAWVMQTRSFALEELNKVRKLWPVVNDGTRKSRHFLSIAIRRFSLAMSRPLPDDKLIDLMICAEALFLRVEINELTYKLAHRTAIFLGETPSQQKEIFKFIKGAYSMRSKVVHGNKSYARDPQDAEQLSSTITILSDYLRKAILKMLDIALNPQAPQELIDWNDLMFNGNASKN